MIVSLFYSAMHLAHARFDQDQLPLNQRHPIGHKSLREDKQIVKWGTNDVVREHYSADVAKRYQFLFQGSLSVRYGWIEAPPINRFFDDYRVIVDLLSRKTP